MFVTTSGKCWGENVWVRSSGLQVLYWVNKYHYFFYRGIIDLFISVIEIVLFFSTIICQVNGRQYFEIADGSTQFSNVTVLLIVIGVFILIIGAIGTVGAICASRVFGRITLGLVRENSYLHRIVLIIGVVIGYWTKLRLLAMLQKYILMTKILWSRWENGL